MPRSQRLAELRREEDPLVVFLRESNVVTSTVYRPGAGDSWFLFFTDEAALARPFFGAFNVAAALLETAVGVASLPFDAGDRLVAGATGLVFSAPELVFANFRKGTLEYGRSAAAEALLEAAEDDPSPE